MAKMKWNIYKVDKLLKIRFAINFFTLFWFSLEESFLYSSIRALRFYWITNNVWKESEQEIDLMSSYLQIIQLNVNGFCQAQSQLQFDWVNRKTLLWKLISLVFLNLNGRQPQLFQMEDNLNFLQMEEDLIFKNGKRPQFFFNRRRSEFLIKMTSIYL